MKHIQESFWQQAATALETIHTALRQAEISAREVVRWERDRSKTGIVVHDTWELTLRHHLNEAQWEIGMLGQRLARHRRELGSTGEQDRAEGQLAQVVGFFQE